MILSDPPHVSKRASLVQLYAQPVVGSSYWPKSAVMKLQWKTAESHWPQVEGCW